jgi:hypothetical protein
MTTAELEQEIRNQVKSIRNRRGCSSIDEMTPKTLVIGRDNLSALYESEYFYQAWVDGSARAWIYGLEVEVSLGVNPRTVDVRPALWKGYGQGRVR